MTNLERLQELAAALTTISSLTGTVQTELAALIAFLDATA